MHQRKIGIIKHIVKHELIVNIHDDGPGREDFQEDQSGMGKGPKQDRENHQSSTNDRQSNGVLLERRICRRVAFQCDVVQFRRENCKNGHGTGCINKNCKAPENHRELWPAAPGLVRQFRQHAILLLLFRLLSYFSQNFLLRQANLTMQDLLSGFSIPEKVQETRIGRSEPMVRRSCRSHGLLGSGPIDPDRSMKRALAPPEADVLSAKQAWRRSCLLSTSFPVVSKGQFDQAKGRVRPRSPTFRP